MSAAREKDQADFDLERFIDMFDEAMTSRDPRVVNALRSLMMMVTLTRPEVNNAGLDNRATGPLRRLFEDMNHLNRRLHSLEDDVRQLRNREASYKEAYKYDYPYEKYSAQAAAELAQKVDQDLLNTLKIKAQGKIQGLK